MEFLCVITCLVVWFWTAKWAYKIAVRKGSTVAEGWAILSFFTSIIGVVLTMMFAGPPEVPPSMKYRTALEEVPLQQSVVEETTQQSPVIEETLLQSPAVGETSHAKFCPHCGFPNPKSYPFCRDCGRKFD